MKRFFNSSVWRFDFFTSLALVVAGCGLLDPPGVSAAEVTVQNVRASQREGTELVDIYYDVIGPDTGAMAVTILVSADAGTTWNVPAYAFSGAFGSGVAPGFDKHVIWNAGEDWDGQFSSRCRVRVIATDPDPTGFALIPAGSFEMGTIFDDGTVHSVFLSAFYMERTEVTKALWDAVYFWGEVHGYSFSNRGVGKRQDHPVCDVSWYDVVKWCNARSEREGLTPVYYTDSNQTAVYRTGQASLSNASVKWSANGYRLPTEAEWEKAARGGLGEKRFPWGNSITHHQANYFSATWNPEPYDTSPTRLLHPYYSGGAQPNTSPVASFPLNGYGLYDMAGNVFEWCWDWYHDSWYSQPAATESDPRGPGSGDSRVLRGGSWSHSASFARCARRYADTPSNASITVGFRCARAE